MILLSRIAAKADFFQAALSFLLKAALGYNVSALRKLALKSRRRPGYLEVQELIGPRLPLSSP
jgi:hypothetical protein